MLLQVLSKTYGKELLMAGVFKLLWSVFVIMGGESVRVFGQLQGKAGRLSAGEESQECSPAVCSQLGA